MRWTTKILSLFFLIRTTVQLADSIYTSGSAQSIPADMSTSGFDKVFFESTQKTTVSIGEAQIFYLRWFASDGQRDSNGNIISKSYTAAFQVNVDDYSQLVIPNSIFEFIKAIIC